MDVVEVEVVRGGVVEAVHRVHAVVVCDDRVELAAGDVDLQTYLRSSAKPIQALPVVRACPELDDEQVALCCASHRATTEQVAIVERILETAGATRDDLECGPEPTRLEHNCSGKHAGFLALCHAQGWPTVGYRLESHPCQVVIREEVAAALAIPAVDLVTAVDGCGVPTFAASLRRLAAGFVRWRSHDGADRIVEAMRARPDLLRGPVAADAVVMRELDGWAAKGGAEGLLCASSDDGVGLVLKVEDGAFRAILPALGRVLGLLGRDAPPAEWPLTNSRDDVVGVVRAR
jgi:L-asparaginase II